MWPWQSISIDLAWTGEKTVRLPKWLRSCWEEDQSSLQRPSSQSELFHQDFFFSLAEVLQALSGFFEKMQVSSILMFRSVELPGPAASLGDIHGFCCPVHSSFLPTWKVLPKQIFLLCFVFSHFSWLWPHWSMLQVKLYTSASLRVRKLL